VTDGLIVGENCPSSVSCHGQADKVFSGDQERSAGVRPGVTTADAQHLQVVECEASAGPDFPEQVDAVVAQIDDKLICQ
jgi:hypothetical protein